MMERRDKEERRHARTANICVTIAYMTFMLVRYYEMLAEGKPELIPTHLIIGAIFALLIIVVFIWIRNTMVQSLLLPALLATGLTLSALFVGGTPILFMAFYGVCGLSGLYFNGKSFVRLVIYINILLFISIVILRRPISGETVAMYNVAFQWILLQCCALFTYLTIRYSTNRHNKSLIARESFDTMLETTPNIVALVDELNCITFLSRPLAELSHLERSDLAAGRPLIDLFNDTHIINMITDVLDSSGDYLDTVEVVRNDEIFFYKIISKKMQGSANGRFIDITDVTPIMTARYEAENATKAKSEFLATMSHEIRTPLNAIIGITQIELQQNGLPAGYATALDKIYTSSNNLLGIINDILDMSKIETGKLELNPNEYDLPSLINDTVQLNIVRIGSKPIRFRLDLDETLPSRMYGDELRLKQILNNLLSNAIKYTEKGHVSLSVSHAVTDDWITLRFAVGDTGQGIKPKEREQLFTEFSRFNAVTNRTTEGTGLGLSITKRLLEMMDGSITVESEYGSGSVFTAEIRQKAVDCPPVGAELAKKLRNFTFNGDRKDVKLKITRDPMPYGNVLVVDDVDTNLFVAEGLMSFYGLDVETADSGFATIDKVTSGHFYDIIFMDHMMPGMDGIETTQKLRAMGYNGAIVALTANAIVGNEEVFAQNGFDGFISKPIDAQQLNLVLNRFVRDQHPNDAKMYAPMTATLSETVTNPKLLRIFRGDAEKAVATLRETERNGDLKLFTTTAHAMKSALANVGEKEAAEAASALEEAGENNDSKFITANCKSFIKTLESLIERLRPDTPDVMDDDDDLAEDTAFLEEQLRIVGEACKEYDDAGAYAALDRLNGKAWSAKTTAALEEIRDTLYLHSDFDGAAEMADKFLR